MKNPQLKKARNYIFFIIMQCVRLFVFFIPWKMAGIAGAALGAAARLLAGREVKKAMRNLDIVYGDKMSVEDKRRLISRNFRNYGIGLFEFM
ncbi:MAG TPA: hypothetical protein P5511_06845, partial [Candidatus Goldiibacteriota bacterium]|nr:hypothetical protein [Candidatus Goldiibacteriota bacterium]